MASRTAAVAHPVQRAPHYFDIAQSRDGLWRVEDRQGLVGGIFRTQKDAVRFAIFEADGDRASIYFPPVPDSRPK
jgi:hypothetical protein